MKKALILCLILCIACSVALCACSQYDYNMKNEYYNDSGAFYAPNRNTSEALADNAIGFDSSSYTEIVENQNVKTADNNEVYLSLDTNTASYTNLRGMINRMKNGGYFEINPDAVRVEEMLNYFSYDYPKPDGDFSFTYSLFDSPYRSGAKLLTLGLKAAEVETNDIANNIVLLIDVSGSMYGPDRLGLIQESFKLITETLKPQDVVSVVTYASGVQCVLDGAYGYEGNKIRAVIEDLDAGGSTNGEGGIELAYKTAEKHFIKGGNNRVILATDGDFNVGKATEGELRDMISKKRDSGIYLSVIGVGYGNLQSDMMESLALNGNGQWSYLDSVNEARKFLVEEFGGNFVTIAKDAKLKVEFNEECVEEYRLIGYENKRLTQEEFDDEKKDAGEIGSGHSVTCVFEVVLKEDAADDLGNVVLRYKNTQDESKEIVSSIKISEVEKNAEEMTVTDRFISAIVEFALVLRKSEYAGNASISEVIKLLQGVKEGDNEYYKDFYSLVETYASVLDESKE